ncbi:MAG: phosphoribosylanthranilate isomerase [Bacteroidota bacterium]
MKAQDLFVKICGITNLQDAELAVSVGADAIGFIFFKDSPRTIAPERARAIAAELPEHISKIGVFVNDDRKSIHDIVDRVHLSAVQLYGKEGPDDLVNYETSVIKAFRVGPGFDVEVMHNYLVDAFLLDAYKEGIFGGTGDTFDWNVAVKAKEYGRIILSGGLNIENIESAVTFVQPYGVDVSSGVELRVGKKDPSRVRDFVAAARNASLTSNIDTDRE